MREKGRAVFVKSQRGLWTLREAVASKMLEDGARTQRYVVTRCESYFAGQLEAVLRDPQERRQHFGEMLRNAVGRRDGWNRCALLTDIDTHEGVLIHYENGWQCSCWPPIDASRIRAEREARLELARVARKMRGIPLEIARPISPGRADWGEVIASLLDGAEARGEKKERL